MTFTEAAAQVLRLVGKPLHYKEITDVAIEKNLLSHVGKSPEVTMGARLAALVKKGDKENPLVRVKPGVFALREWDQDTIEKGLKDRTPALERLSLKEVDFASEAETSDASHVSLDDFAEEGEPVPPDATERARAQLALQGTDLFESEDDDDQPILGEEAEEGDDAQKQDANGRRRRRRRRRGRMGEERSAGDDLPSYTVSDAPAGLELPLAAEVREPREAREPREPREPRAPREPRDVKEPTEAREPRPAREPRESREIRDTPEARDSREGRDSRESRDGREAGREPREASREPREASREPRDASREPREASREPREASREPREASREPREASREPREASREPRDGREPREAGREPRDGRESREAGREGGRDNREAREGRGDRDREGRERSGDADRGAPLGDLAGRSLADAVESLLGGFDRTRGPVPIQALVDLAQRRGRLNGDAGSAPGLICAAARADNARRAAEGRRPRFRINTNKIALSEWQLDGEMARAERELGSAIERYRESARRSLLRTISDLPHRACGELVVLLLEHMGYVEVAAVRRPGSHGAELHLTARARGGSLDVRTAIVVRRDGREIGRERVTELRGALHHYGPAHAGLLITAGQVLSGAREEAAAAGATPVAVIDGANLARLCEEHAVGVAPLTLRIPMPDLELLDGLRAG